MTKTFYVVYPCSQWRREYPREAATSFVWFSRRWAMECRDDVGGFMVKINVKEKK